MGPDSTPVKSRAQSLMEDIARQSYVLGTDTLIILHFNFPVEDRPYRRPTPGARRNSKIKARIRPPPASRKARLRSLHAIKICTPPV